jgi:hypothetical protein
VVGHPLTYTVLATLDTSSAAVPEFILASTSLCDLRAMGTGGLPEDDPHFNPKRDLSAVTCDYLALGLWPGAAATANTLFVSVAVQADGYCGQLAGVDLSGSVATVEINVQPAQSVSGRCKGSWLLSLSLSQLPSSLLTLVDREIGADEWKATYPWEPQATVDLRNPALSVPSPRARATELQDVLQAIAADAFVRFHALPHMVSELTVRRWDDASLGCSPVIKPQGPPNVAGYLVTVAHFDSKGISRRIEYHAGGGRTAFCRALQ